VTGPLPEASHRYARRGAPPPSRCATTGGRQATSHQRSPIRHTTITRESVGFHATCALFHARCALVPPILRQPYKTASSRVARCGTTRADWRRIGGTFCRIGAPRAEQGRISRGIAYPLTPESGASRVESYTPNGARYADHPPPRPRRRLIHNPGAPSLCSPTGKIPRSLGRCPHSMGQKSHARWPSRHRAPRARHRTARSGLKRPQTSATEQTGAPASRADWPTYCGIKRRIGPPTVGFPAHRAWDTSLF